MVLFYIYQQPNPLCQKAWMINTNDFSKSLSLLFDHLLESNSNLNISSLFNISRHQFHDKLSMHNPHSFPQLGMVGVSVTDILELVFPPCKLIAVILCTNEECNKVSQIEEAMQTSLPTVCLFLRYIQDYNLIACNRS